MSTAYHPQSDGQTERVNQCVQNVLRCMVFKEPKTWCKWLPMAEWWYNTSLNSSLNTTPFPDTKHPNYLWVHLLRAMWRQLIKFCKRGTRYFWSWKSNYTKRKIGWKSLLILRELRDNSKLEIECISNYSLTDRSQQRECIIPSSILSFMAQVRSKRGYCSLPIAVASGFSDSPGFSSFSTQSEVRKRASSVSSTAVGGPTRRETSDWANCYHISSHGEKAKCSGTTSAHSLVQPNCRGLGRLWIHCK